MSLLARKQGMFFDDFASHWAGPHAAIATQMPGIAAYTQNRVRETLWTKAGHTVYQVDGIVELRFESDAAMAEAGKTRVVTHLLPEDEHRFLRGITLCVVESGTAPGTRGDGPGAPTKIVLFGARAAAVEPAQFRAGVELLAELGLRHAEAVGLDWTKNCYGRPDLWQEPVQPDVFLSLWFANRSDAEALFSSGSEFVASADRLFEQATAAVTDPLRIV